MLQRTPLPKPNSSTKQTRKEKTSQKKPQSTSRVENDPEVTPEVEGPSKPPKDITLETYTLQKMVMLGDVVVIEDTDFLKHNEFDYRQFETLTIRKLDKSVSDPTRSFEFVSGSATISAKNVPARLSLVMTVEDVFGWTKVEKGIERWMMENKKEITIKLAIVYKKTGESDSETSDDEKPVKKKVSPFGFG